MHHARSTKPEDPSHAGRDEPMDIGAFGMASTASTASTAKSKASKDSKDSKTSTRTETRTMTLK